MEDDDQPEVSRTAFAQPRLRQRRTPPVQSPFREEMTEENTLSVPMTEEGWKTYAQAVGSGVEGSPHAPLTVTSTEPVDELRRPRANLAEIANTMSTVFTGLVMLGFTGIGLLAKLRRQEMGMPRPSQSEADAVASPLSRIVARHAPVEFASTVANDILDAAEAAGAVSDYVERTLSKPIRHVPTEGTAQ